MTLNVADPKFFREALTESLENTINFENCTEFTKYENEETKDTLTSSLGILYHENYILNTIIPYLKENSKIETFTEDSASQYYGKPLALSFDKYGTIDYWWILLAVNGFINPSDFNGWLELIIPSTQDIAKIIDKELFVNEDIGKL